MRFGRLKIKKITEWFKKLKPNADTALSIFLLLFITVIIVSLIYNMKSTHQANEQLASQQQNQPQSEHEQCKKTYPAVLGETQYTTKSGNQFTITIIDPTENSQLLAIVEDKTYHVTIIPLDVWSGYLN